MGQEVVTKKSEKSSTVLHYFDRETEESADI